MKALAALTTLILCAGLQPVSADVLLIEEVRASQNMNLPARGQTKSQVEGRFGSPVSRHGPVGDPPISCWKYDRYSVYFEYDHVITSVLHRGEVIDSQNTESQTREPQTTEASNTDQE